MMDEIVFAQLWRWLGILAVDISGSHICDID
jgi:hypothetical protein